PRLPLPTGPVFGKWVGQDHGPLPSDPAAAITREGRNDLEAPAIALCPAIADVLAGLRGTGAALVRMSGSGATCFALYDSQGQREHAASAIATAQPDWWQLQGRLR